MGAPPESLDALAERAARGDRSALRAIYEQTADRLYRDVIAPIVAERAGSEDALKETFLAALQRLPSLARGEVFPWLAAIARNKALDRRRRQASASRFGALLAAELARQETAQATPEVELAAAQARAAARERVEAVLERMNPRYARALRLRLLEERPRAECAERLATSLGAFDVLLFRACKQFRALYVERYGAAGGVP
jgi:RNA polymerase sigma-70 factor (ECF subfamily)